MGRIGSKQCGLLIAAVVVLCLCVALCACDADDIKEFINPQGSITFVLNNGEENVLWHKGEQVPVPTLDGYKFVCWCADRELKYEAAINFETSAIYENLYLYAKWQKLGEFVDLKFESYEVTYDGLSHCLEVSGAPKTPRSSIARRRNMSMPACTKSPQRSKPKTMWTQALAQRSP